MLKINLTKQNFENEVLRADGLVLVDFWATWCGPCRMISPILDEFAEQYKEKVKVFKINIDEQKELANKYQISSIPTLILFKNGSIQNMIVGFCSKRELEKIINI